MLAPFLNIIKMNHDNFISKKGARAILLDEQGRVLLGKRAKGIESGKWCLIGGKPEEGETTKEAVIREVKEEISIDFEPIFYRNFKGIDKNKKVKWTSAYFIGHINSHQLQGNLNLAELAEVRFFSKEELANQEIAFDHKKVLEKFFSDLISTKNKT